MHIDPERWTTSEGGITIGKTISEKQINNTLRDLRTAIENKYNQLVILGQLLTAVTIKNSLFKVYDKEEKATEPKLESVMLKEHFQNFNNNYKALIGIETTQKSWMRYELTLKKIILFMKDRYKIENIALHDVNTQFIKNFFIWLRTTEQNSHNYHLKHIQRFGTVFHEAIDNGWVAIDPFKNFKMSFEEVDRGYLSYCDVQKLKKDEIVLGEDGNMWIKTERGKTKAKLTSLC